MSQYVQDFIERRVSRALAFKVFRQRVRWAIWRGRVRSARMEERRRAEPGDS